MPLMVAGADIRRCIPWESTLTDKSDDDFRNKKITGHKPAATHHKMKNPGNDDSASVWSSASPQRLVEAPAVRTFYTLAVLWIMGSVARSTKLLCTLKTCLAEGLCWPVQCDHCDELQPTCHAHPHGRESGDLADHVLRTDFD